LSAELIIIALTLIQHSCLCEMEKGLRAFQYIADSFPNLREELDKDLRLKGF
jgi:hypothetical protein